MNNSLARLIDGMVATLREEVIPQVGTEFARGQAFGVIYMLNSIRLRAAWSSQFLGEQLAAQTALATSLKPLVKCLTSQTPSDPLQSRTEWSSGFLGERLEIPPLPKAPAAGADNEALEALRDRNDQIVCDWILWLDEQGDTLSDTERDAFGAALHDYMNRQLKLELSTSAKPMFAEISAGAE